MTATLELTSRSPAQTQRLGEIVGGLAAAGDVFLLTGNLGAGKTCLTQGLARGLGVKDDVLSPSFTIVRELRGRLPLYHLDLYRLDNPGELAELGLEEYLDPAGVCVIEWAEKAGGLLPPEHLGITLEDTGGEVRRIRLQASGPHYEETLAQIEELVSHGLSAGA